MKVTNCGARLLHVRGKMLLPGESTNLSLDDFQHRGVRLLVEAGRVSMSRKEIEEVVKALKAKLGPKADLATLDRLLEGATIPDSNVPAPPKDPKRK